MFLIECLNSILENIEYFNEIVIIDDGSIDNTCKILESYRKLYQGKLELIKNSKSLGLASSLNLGLCSVKSDLVLRMDADYVMLKGRIDKYLNIFRSDRNIVACGGDAQLVDKNSRIVGEFKKRSGYVDKINYSSPFIHPTVMFKRLDALAVGGYPNVVFGQDLFFFYKLKSRGRLINMGQAVIRYRIHPLSSSRRSYFLRTIYKLSFIFFKLDERTLIYSNYLLTKLKANKSQKSKIRDYNLTISGLTGKNLFAMPDMLKFQYFLSVKFYILILRKIISFL